MFNISEQKRIE